MQGHVASAVHDGGVSEGGDEFQGNDTWRHVEEQECDFDVHDVFVVWFDVSS